jgi:hypothetical protein
VNPFIHSHVSAHSTALGNRFNTHLSRIEGAGQFFGRDPHKSMNGKALRRGAFGLIIYDLGLTTERQLAVVSGQLLVLRSFLGGLGVLCVRKGSGFLLSQE